MTLLEEVRNMSCYELQDFVLFLVERLDELDQSDYFGESGWEKLLIGDYFDGSNHRQ